MTYPFKLFVRTMNNEYGDAGYLDCLEVFLVNTDFILYDKDLFPRYEVHFIGASIDVPDEHKDNSLIQIIYPMLEERGWTYFYLPMRHIEEGLARTDRYFNLAGFVEGTNRLLDLPHAPLPQPAPNNVPFTYRDALQKEWRKRVKVATVLDTDRAIEALLQVKP